jgi:hypothetical protein
MNLWTLAQRAGRFAVALTRHAQDGFAPASPETIASRLAICQQCDQLQGDVCQACGCNCNNGGLLNKLAWASEACPLGKWPAGEMCPGEPIAKIPRPKLTVGMACYKDFDGVYFTVMSLSIHHRELLRELEILVVDSCPEFPDRSADPHGPRTPSERIRDLCNNVPNARYVEHRGPGGTSQPRNQVFTEARGEVVICIDSHVLIPSGALRRTIDWFAANPDFHGLVQGPLLYDNGLAITHMDPVWDDQMLGKWGIDPRYAGPDSEVLEIPMHGLGLFGCRREDWLGFHPEFRQFGGEEGYIHDKYRAAGQKTLLLPWLEWGHRFGDGRAGYPSSPRARIKNYILGRIELGLDVDDIREHFFGGEFPRYHPHEWGEILEEVAGSMVDTQ